MNELDRLNNILKSEADIILHDHGVMETLRRHGEPVVRGSYALDTMACADLDIYLICDSPDPAGFFSLGREILALLQPIRLDYHNNLTSHWPQFPRGLYWGVRTDHNLSRSWKLDIWCLDPAGAQACLDSASELRQAITPELRQVILEIKSHLCNHPAYGIRFSSMDIYNAVLDRGVCCTAEFAELLRENGLHLT